MSESNVNDITPGDVVGITNISIPGVRDLLAPC